LVYLGNNTLFLLGGHGTAGVNNLRLNASCHGAQVDAGIHAPAVADIEKRLAVDMATYRRSESWESKTSSHAVNKGVHGRQVMASAPHDAPIDPAWLHDDCRDGAGQILSPLTRRRKEVAS
jgi:hypothetical protein